ncbi:HNH endonuclease [Microbacterium phage Squash]|uniref:HNH endonuclease n=1 Tax=Microbacterium phage Squash TaxID=2182357 RepID=A0A2U8ULP4_9CAUD|nr:HNH endonuclease [Microbacterium phage Squash]AWN04674.1 HNH endonuclease [Microbacterium phage Squash]
MILTPEILEKIVTAIEQKPDAPVTLPDHAYGRNGKARILVDGLPIDLHRHLHNLLIRPLEQNERMHDQSGVKGNVNPHLFTVIKGGRSPALYCPNNHPYAGNEAPPNSRGYRCAICLKNSQPERAGLANADKTECPEGHPYNDENTYIDSAGRRRCLICKRDTDARYRRRQKEGTPS